MVKMLFVDVSGDSTQGGKTFKHNCIYELMHYFSVSTLKSDRNTILRPHK